MIKHSDKLLNVRAIKLRISPTRTFDRSEDSLGELDFLLAKIFISGPDLVGFFGLRLLLKVEKTLDAPCCLSATPAVIEFGKTASRLWNLLLKRP